MKIIEEQKVNNENIKHSDVLSLNNQLEKKKLLWTETKIALCNDVRAIIWKAWIEPLDFKKYENSVLYLSAPSYLISSRAETQYYETIFLQANKIFENIKKIKILKETPKKIINELKTKSFNYQI